MKLPKYCLYIDHVSGVKPPIEYKMLEAEDLTNAILEVDKLWRQYSFRENTYLTIIMKKSSASKSIATYADELWNRGHGWYRGNEFNERPHGVRCCAINNGFGVQQYHFYYE